MSQILAKLGVSSREEAAVWAREPVAAGDGGWRAALGAMLARLPTAGRIGLIGTAGAALAGLAVLAGLLAYNELSGDDDSRDGVGRAAAGAEWRSCAMGICGWRIWTAGSEAMLVEADEP